MSHPRHFPPSGVLVVFTILLIGAAFPTAAQVRVGTVTIRHEALFDPAEASRGAFYRALNAVQSPSSESFIRSMLLFKEGDLLDEQRIRESERSLRGLDFLESVSVKTSEPHDGVVDVLVDVHDAFTTDVNGDFSNDGGRSLYTVEVDQKNLFGRGIEVDARTAELRERHSNSVELLAPSFFRPYWNADTLLAKNSDGNEERFSLERPLFSYAVRSTSLGSFDRLVQKSRIYANGVVSSLFRQSHRDAAGQFGWVLFSSPHLSTRLLGGFDALDDHFSTISGQRPFDRHFRFVEAGADLTAFRFLTLDHIDYGLRAQDFNVGTHLSLFGAASPGVRRVYRFRSDNSIGHQFTRSSFVIARLSFSTRAGETNRDSILSVDTRLVSRARTKQPLTFVARARIDAGSDLDRDVQFFADGQNGLRAYPDFAFEGKRRVLLNAEERWALGREWFQLIEPGLAAFADAGQAVNQRLDIRGFRTDAGVGLRAGIARYESAMLRLDISYAFQDSPTSRRGLVISFATIQAF